MPDRAKYQRADYEFVPDDPPLPSELERNMALAAEHPDVWCRLVTYAKASTASTTASDLRRSVRHPNRPEGTWEFISEDIGEGKFAVKAKFTPPT